VQGGRTSFGCVCSHLEQMGYVRYKVRGGLLLLVVVLVLVLLLLLLLVVVVLLLAVLVVLVLVEGWLWWCCWCCWCCCCCCFCCCWCCCCPCRLPMLTPFFCLQDFNTMNYDWRVGPTNSCSCCSLIS